MNQTKEAARQILGSVSDIQAVVSVSGMDEVSLKLADIREKAAYIFEGDQSQDKIVAAYEREAMESITMLNEMIVERGQGLTSMGAADMLQLIRMAEIFIRRGRVYLDRRARYNEMVDSQNAA